MLQGTIFHYIWIQLHLHLGKDGANGVKNLVRGLAWSELALRVENDDEKVVRLCLLEGNSDTPSQRRLLSKLRPEIYGWRQRWHVPYNTMLCYDGLLETSYLTSSNGIEVWGHTGGWGQVSTWQYGGMMPRSYYYEAWGHTRGRGADFNDEILISYAILYSNMEVSGIVILLWGLRKN